jgi:glycosyltransferase involved in cell wall biosynthesis
MQFPPDLEPRVGYVVNSWPRLSQTFILNEVLSLERRGVSLRIFSLKKPKGEPIHASVAQVRAEVTYLALRPSWKRVALGNLRFACRQPRRYFRSLLEALVSGFIPRFLQAGYLASVIHGQSVTHLHAHFAHAPTVVTMFASRLTRIPFTFTAHAKDLYVKASPELLRVETQRDRAVITCTDYNRRYLISQLSASSNGKLHCIYHGLDLAQVQFQWPRELNGRPPVILSVARLVEKKGLSDLLAAVDILRRRGRSFRVEIVGEGPQRQALQDQVARLDLNDYVSLAGAQTYDAVCRAYERASIFALPCLVAPDGDRDGIPNVLLEAMGSGIPVVASAVSGIPELIESERNGLLVPPSSPVELADALDRLLASPDLRNRLTLAARRKIETHFSIERSSMQLLALFQDGAVGPLSSEAAAK